MTESDDHYDASFERAMRSVRQKMKTRRRKAEESYCKNLTTDYLETHLAIQGIRGK